MKEWGCEELRDLYRSPSVVRIVKYMTLNGMGMQIGWEDKIMYTEFFNTASWLRIKGYGRATLR
jgi:hypothetical protein